MTPSHGWRALLEMARANGLGGRVLAIPEDPTTPGFGKRLRRGDPPLDALSPWLPPEYRAFVAETGYTAVDFGEGAKLAFLPPRLMCQVTGAMGEPGQEFGEVRALREQGRYDWRFAFFAGRDLADVSGWCFRASASTAPSVWSVEESLPTRSVGAFDVWIGKQIAALSKRIDSPAKGARVLRRLREDEGLEETEKLPTLSLSDFGA